MSIVTFESESDWLTARHKNINSTEVAALFGLGSYATAFEIAVEKQQPAPSEFAESDRMRWGKRLQDAIAQGVADDHGVAVESMELVYGQHPDVRLGSSFDYKIISYTMGAGRGADSVNDPMVRSYLEHGPGVLEIKNVDGLQFLRNWTDGEAPAQIEIQLQTQLEVLDLPWGCIAAFVGGNRIETIVRERDRAVGQAIVERVGKFWYDFGRGIMPPPLMPEDADCLIKLYQYAEPEKVYDGNADEELAELCRSYSAASRNASQCETAKKVLKAKILQHIGAAERAILPGFKISAGMVAGAEIAFTREPFRMLRVTEKKDKDSGKNPTPDNE